MPQASQEDLAWARSSGKPIHAVRWSTNQARIVRTKKRGHELLRLWKAWKERQGWRVRGNPAGGYLAESPAGLREAAALCTYDPDTLQQIH